MWPVISDSSASRESSQSQKTYHHYEKIAYHHWDHKLFMSCADVKHVLLIAKAGYNRRNGNGGGVQEGVMMEEGRGGRGSGKKEYCWGDGWDGCWLQPVDPAGSRPRRLFWSPWFSCLCASFFMAFARVAPFGPPPSLPTATSAREWCSSSARGSVMSKAGSELRASLGPKCYRGNMYSVVLS